MKKTYHGSCHCGRVRFEAEIDLEAGSGRCNCSICTKKRNWGVTIKPADFWLISGKDDLADYQFGSGQSHHRFCKVCGIAMFGDGDIKEIGGAYVSVSVACLDDVSPEELARVPIRYMDGRDNNWYAPPKVTSYL
jgi:hypothetical protein